MTATPSVTPSGSGATPWERRWERRFAELLDWPPFPRLSGVIKVRQNWRSGFRSIRPLRVIGVRGATSLARLQDVCHEHRSLYLFRSARYRLSEPSLGSLLAAFVADLDLLESGDPQMLVGDLRPGKATLDPLAENLRPTEGSRIPVAGNVQLGTSSDPLRAGRLAKLVTAIRDRADGTLSQLWQQTFLDMIRDVLGPGGRLVLFAELEGATGDQWVDLEAMATRLPDQLALVVVWPWPDAMPGWMIPLDDVPPGPSPRVIATFVDAPLTGDQLAEIDTLGRQRYAAALANLVMLPATGPITIGVHGRWGTGKSSFMRFIRWELVRIALADRPKHRHELEDAEGRIADAARLEREDIGGYVKWLRYRDEARQQLAKAVADRARLLDRLERVAADTVLCVRFNAWLYEGATQIWAGLTHELTRAMEQSLPWWRRLSVRVGYALRVHGPGFWIGAAAGVVVAALAAGLALVLGFGATGGAAAQSLPAGLDVVARLLPLGSVLAVWLLLGWRFARGFVPVSGRVAQYLRQPDYRQHMGYQHQVQGDIEFLKARLGRKGRTPRIVVFIDDLDRCSDERVLETLQAINLLLNERGFYVFLGIDTEMIIKAIQRWYQAEADSDADTAGRARDYLDKILQLNVPLREPDRAQAVEYLASFFSREAVRQFRSRAATMDTGDEWFEPVDRGELRWERRIAQSPPVYDFQVQDVEDTADELGAFDALRDHLPASPRELKRLLNVHRLVRLFARQSDWRPGPAARRLIVGWLVFCLARPEAAAEVVTKARSDPEGSGVMSELERIEFIETDDDAEAVALTNADLLPGTPLGETWEIAALFHRTTTTKPAS
jgi:KAP family P-loop domain